MLLFLSGQRYQYNATDRYECVQKLTMVVFASSTGHTADLRRRSVRQLLEETRGREEVTTRHAYVRSRKGKGNGKTQQY